MLALRVEKRFAESAKRELLEKGAFARGFNALRDERFVFFPALKRVRISARHSFVQRKFASIETPKPLKKLLPYAASSYDLVGNIAIVEIPPSQHSKRKKIAETLLRSNKRIKTVLAKASVRKGKFRLKEYAWLAGERKTLALHKESGCVFRVDLARAYFSPRLSSERLRIASMAKNGEKVLVLFSGVSPFDIVIAKRKRVLTRGVELNPAAVRLAKENIVLNKLEGKSQAYCGDAKAYAKKFGGWADRILMPSPTLAHDFLGVVAAKARKGCVIHYYDTGGENEGIFKSALGEIRNACVAQKRKFRVLGKRKVLPYAPRVFTIAIDFKLLN